MDAAAVARPGLVSAQRGCPHRKRRRQGRWRVGFDNGGRRHVARYSRHHWMAAGVALSQSRREGRRRRCRTPSRRIREPQHRPRVFQECNSRRHRRSAAPCRANLRLDVDPRGSRAGAARLALVDGADVRRADFDRIPRMADVRRCRECSGTQKPAMSQPEVNSSAARNRQIENAIFLIPFVTYAYFYQGSDQSIACRFDLMRSMLEKSALWINDFCGYNTADIITVGGHIYSVKAPGTSFTALIPWVIFKLLLMPLQTTHEPLYWAFTTYLTTLFTTGLLISISCVVMYRFARFFGASEGRATGIALILGLATICFPYATELTGEPVAGAFVFIAFYLVATFSTRPSSARAFAAGFLAGWAVLNDYPVFVVAAAIGIYALFKLPEWKPLAAFSMGALLTAVIVLAYNWGAFGSPLFFSYQAFKLAENRQFPEQAVGFVGLTYPKARVLWNVLLDPERGLFFCNPVLLLSILGVAYFARLRQWRAEFVVTVYSFVVLILFNAAYGESIVSWGGGTATGPRQIVASVPFMVLALAFLPAASNFLLGAFGALSAAIMLMATATNPHFPYEYDNPVRDFALQQFMRGDFATNRDAFFGGGMIVGDSVAFNLGKLIGLPGPFQLWPLAGFWIFGAFDLSDTLELWGNGASRRLTQLAAAIGISAVFLLSMSQKILQPF